MSAFVTVLITLGTVIVYDITKWFFWGRHRNADIRDSIRDCEPRKIRYGGGDPRTRRVRHW